ncbi:MAG: ABC transporter substrate-binding protein [Firmicutes bacterium]|nr:ABC transporter substrate-binding protein [Bacillota bacterium]
MKNVLAVVLALCMIFSFAACGKKDEGSKEKDSWTVGICQLVQHPALDKATQGFIDAVKAELGDKVEFIEQNGSGEPANCTTIVNDFVSRGVDLIMANATPALQAAAAATDTIPILGTAVTHYAPALGITEWTGTVGGNISGTSDLASLEEQAKMVKEWFPDAKKVAILFCSSEANSIFQAQEVEAHLKGMGLEVQNFTFTDTNDVASVTLQACNFADVLYIPTDNVAAANAESIANVVLTEGKPVIAGEKELCKGCGVASLSIDYYDLGVATGKMAVKILRDGADISAMPIETAPETARFFNKDICEKLGITPLEGYAAIE